MSERRPEAELLTLHDRFCAGFARPDADAVLATVADTSDLVVVTSEQPLLRGQGELRAFLERYVRGPTRYSWAWDSRDVFISGDCAWLLAVGTETTSSDLGTQATPYPMTLVAQRVGDRWLSSKFTVHRRTTPEARPRPPTGREVIERASVSSRAYSS